MGGQDVSEVQERYLEGFMSGDRPALAWAAGAGECGPRGAEGGRCAGRSGGAHHEAQNRFLAEGKKRRRATGQARSASRRRFG